MPASGRLLVVARPMLRAHRTRNWPVGCGTVWWRPGPGGRGGVLALPGAVAMAWARPVHWPPAQRPALRSAERAGLREAPDAAQPGGGVVRPGVRRQRRPLFRWLALVGLAALGLGIAGWAASQDDRPLNLYVVHDDGDGTCEVEAPRPGTDRWLHAVVGCPADRDTRTGSRVAGWEVSYWPFKGDIYDADGRGTAADVVVAWLAVGGLLLLVGGVLGGGAGRVARRRTPGTPVIPVHRQVRDEVVSLQKDLVVRSAEDEGPGRPPACASLAEAAERQACPGSRRAVRPGPDVRSVPWWRVPGLQRISQLRGALGAGSGAAVPLTLWALWSDVAGAAPLVLGVLNAAAALLAAFRAYVGGGIRVARMLARAARAPVPVPRRYVLLPGDSPEDALLLLFAAHGSADDPPEEFLVLVAPRTSVDKETKARIPIGLPAPTGEAQLHGWVDADPIVVPWIDGRPYWPLCPLTPLSREDDDPLLRRLHALADWGRPGAPHRTDG
ncbi:hypothetical protein AB0M28_29515 [Streptomyces sp. NPDC051940]|uniref:hypothetical protein n=1 Tax=Streptomyces sp. NPDC051940 TaxID=3155675 RepID=UPI003430F28B